MTRSWSRGQRCAIGAVFVLVLAGASFLLFVGPPFSRGEDTATSSAPTTTDGSDPADGEGQAAVTLPPPSPQLAVETLAWVQGEGRPAEAFLDHTEPLLAVTPDESARSTCDAVAAALDGGATPQQLTDLTARIPDRLLAELHLATQDARISVLQRCGVGEWQGVGEEVESARRTDALIDQRLAQLETAAR